MSQRRKRTRPTAAHMLKVMEEHRGRGLRFRDLKLAMIRHGWIHVDSAVVHTYQWLLAQGKIIKAETEYGNYYGIPKDGMNSIEPMELEV